MAKAKVILFKPSGKYYTEEEWEIPTAAELEKKQSHLLLRYRLHDHQPACMRLSDDFRRIGGGAVLVETQEPWGFPHLLPGEEAELT